MTQPDPTPSPLTRGEEAALRERWQQTTSEYAAWFAQPGFDDDDRNPEIELWRDDVGALLATLDAARHEVQPDLRAAHDALPEAPAGSGLYTRIRAAAIAECEEHFEDQHVNLIPPCPGALQDAQRWAARLAPR